MLSKVSNYHLELQVMGHESITTSDLTPMSQFYNTQSGYDWPWYSSNPCTSTVTDTANIHIFFTWQNKVSIETGIYGINAKGISIRWKPDDFPSQTATPTAGNAKSTQSGGSHPDTKSSGLSIGTKAGIEVASALGTTTLLVIVSLVYRRRRKTGLNVIVRSDKPRESDSRPIHEASRGSVYEIYSGIGAYDGIHEMESSGSATNPVEMPTCT